MSELKRMVVSAVTRGFPIGVLWAALITFDQGWRIGVPGGIGTGIAFGMCCELLDLFMRWLQPHDQPSFRGETLLKAAEATAVVGNETVRGWLYLTNKQLHFRSNPGDFTRRYTWDVAVADVRRADATRTLGFIANRLSIVTLREPERFLIDGNKSWAAAIASAKAAAEDSSA